MKKKQCVAIAAMLLFLLTIPIVLLVWGFVLPAQYSETFLGELGYKVERLEQAEGKRIIVIGGSGVAFSLQSDLIAQELPEYEPVNFGLYASLGTKVMLDMSKAELRPGDIILISPEQDPQPLSLYFNGEAMWQAVDGNFKILRLLDGENLGNMAGEFPAFAARKFNYLVQKTKPMPQNIYNRAAFNTYGDISFNGRIQNVMDGGYDPNTPICFRPETISKEFIAYMNSYNDYARQRGASVYYYFGPSNASALAGDGEKDLDTYYNWLGQQLAFPVLGNPHNAVMDSRWFYDTNFHLNESGAVKYTKQLVRDLKLLLRDPSVTNIADPELPELARTMLVAGVNSDADCFTYEQTENGLRLTGLTEAGRQRTELTLPTSRGGMPVVALDAMALRNSTVLQAVIIQSNIRRIEDNSFRGCSSLRKIILVHPAPDECVVGSGLLEGTVSCLIYVPLEVEFAYKTSYFWQEYASHIRASK